MNIDDKTYSLILKLKRLSASDEDFHKIRTEILEKEISEYKEASGREKISEACDIVISALALLYSECVTQEIRPDLDSFMNNHIDGLNTRLDVSSSMDEYIHINGQVHTYELAKMLTSKFIIKQKTDEEFIKSEAECLRKYTK